VVKRVKDLIEGVYSEKSQAEAERVARAQLQQDVVDGLDEVALAREIKRVEKNMLQHARQLEFEQAAQARDQLQRLRSRLLGMGQGSPRQPRAA
jgi:excinuclease ABC subunit B